MVKRKKTSKNHQVLLKMELSELKIVPMSWLCYHIASNMLTKVRQESLIFEMGKIFKKNYIYLNECLCLQFQCRLQNKSQSFFCNGNYLPIWYGRSTRATEEFAGNDDHRSNMPCLNLNTAHLPWDNVEFKLVTSVSSSQ